MPKKVPSLKNHPEAGTPKLGVTTTDHDIETYGNTIAKHTNTVDPDREDLGLPPDWLNPGLRRKPLSLASSEIGSARGK